MKLIFVIIFFLLLSNCSFDNKSGVWKNENIESEIENETFSEFKKILTADKVFEKTIIPKDLKFNFPEPITNSSWNDIYFSYNNNLQNFKFDNSNSVVLKSKKISRKLVNGRIIYEEGNVIINNSKGDIIVYSLKEDREIFKFNFYKKKFKKIEKEINYIVENNIIYAADNLGYLYSLNYKTGKLLWAKYYNIPFSSNLKIYKNKIAVSNQNNNLKIFNKNTGELVKLIPTEETTVKTEFKNSLSMNNYNSLFFLNSFGSLYSINFDTMKVNWFNNFNQSFQISSTNLFLGNQILNNDNIIVLSSNTKTYLIDQQNGSTISSFNFFTKIKPIIIENYIFLLTENNFLITLDILEKKIIYSLDVANYSKKNIKIKKDQIYKDIMILNGKIFIFLNNSNILIFDINGKFDRKMKLPSKMHSFPISIENSILFLDNKNKLIVLN